MQTMTTAYMAQAVQCTPAQSLARNRCAQWAGYRYCLAACLRRAAADVWRRRNRLQSKGALSKVLCSMSEELLHLELVLAPSIP